MLRLSDIMTRDVLSLSPDLSVRDAMEALSSNHMSGAPVVAGRSVVGVISTTDLLEFATSLPGTPTERPEPTAWEEEGRGGDDEVEGDEPAASFFVEMWDDAGAEADVRFESIDGPEWNVLQEHAVSEAMAAGPVCSLPSHTPVQSAAAYMRTRGIHRVLVVDEGELRGIVTSMDITRAVADGKLEKRTYLFDKRSSFDERGWE